MKKYYKNLSAYKEESSEYCYTKVAFIWLLNLGTMFLILFVLPKLDILASKMLYKPYQGFYHKDNYLALLSFKYTPLIVNTAAIIYFSVLIYQYFIHKKIDKRVIYLIITLALGPGLIVNMFFKNTFGRARPLEIIEFGGKKVFNGPFIISNQCDTNCSFTSGHAAAGFYFTCFSFILPRQKFSSFFHLGLIFGCLVGLGRIVQGAHFLSDVLGSGIVVIFINYICRELIFNSNYTR